MKKKKNKLIKSFVILMTSVTMLTSCSLFERDRTTETGEIFIETDPSRLNDGAFYVKKDKDEFHRAYVGNTNFTEYKADASDETRVAWFGENIDKIPVAYKGEEIVMYSSTYFDEPITVERFYDEGYTMGISMLFPTESGRYGLDIQSDSLNVNINSSAAQINQIDHQTTSLILDTIGETPLRSGNVSPSGTIRGLSKGKVYKCRFYAGTQLEELDIVADVKQFVSAEYDEIIDYSFDKGQTISFTFPSNYNSGYYFINGYGFVKYIAQDKKSDAEGIDMNIPNVYLTDEEKAERINDKSTETKYIEAQDVSTASFKVNEQREISVSVSYYDIGDDAIDGSIPTAKIIGESGAYTLNKADGNKLEGKYLLEPGTYQIQVIGLNGRSFTYNTDLNSNVEEEIPETPETEEDKQKKIEEEIKNEQNEILNNKSKNNEKQHSQKDKTSKDEKPSMADSIKQDMENKKGSGN